MLFPRGCTGLLGENVIGMTEVRLRPIRITDADRCLRWVSHPEVLRYLGLVQSARSIEQERSWIASVLADKQHQRTFIIENEQGLAIGTCGLRNIDHSQESALLGILIGDPRWWGQGYGAAATSALVAYGFESLNLQEIRLACHTENTRALRCYEKVGFLPATALQRFEVRPNEIAMVFTRERWHALQQEQSLGQTCDADC
jgi:[ribosomal protein S5]-alanine N-acetyltransferase